jgi:hypothetical protein
MPPIVASEADQVVVFLAMLAATTLWRPSSATSTASLGEEAATTLWRPSSATSTVSLGEEADEALSRL